MRYFEERLDEENIKSKKIAWIAFFLMVLCNILLTFTIFEMMPLKMTDVKLVVVDKNTGLPSNVTALQDVSNKNVRKMKGIKALNQFFVYEYIQAHDSYNYFSIRSMYAKVQLYSTQQVFNEYTATRFGKGKNNVAESLGSDRDLAVVVLSMTEENVPTEFMGDRNAGFTMRVRVERQVTSGNNVESRQRGTVLITYGYNATLNMDEKARSANPLGFTVTSYRFTPDMSIDPNADTLND